MHKILLIEDDPLLVDIYTTKLKEAGFKTVLVDHAEKALEVIDAAKPDVILLDIVLPHIDGWEILQSIRQNSSFKDIKIIILSNLGEKEEIERGLRLGADQYLIKAHYTPSEVVQQIKNLIGETPPSIQEHNEPGEMPLP